VPRDLPLCRQADVFARVGVELGRSTLAGWIGQTAFALRSLETRCQTRSMATTR
jgi:transposase